eukprot:gb/GFBE01017312.1/.p1 GENE.gb/GFBE01017312.1/~~gb/GFBE01017312.1/.p1  ORF type:complete len:157 (+),score=27.00 gb/GFBE01017312.1/:1-471(+)
MAANFVDRLASFWQVACLSFFIPLALAASMLSDCSVNCLRVLAGLSALCMALQGFAPLTLFTFCKACAVVLLAVYAVTPRLPIYVILSIYRTYDVSSCAYTMAQIKKKERQARRLAAEAAAEKAKDPVVRRHPTLLADVKGLSRKVSLGKDVDKFA